MSNDEALRCACGESWEIGRCKHRATQEDRLCDDCRRSKTCTESRARQRERSSA